MRSIYHINKRNDVGRAEKKRWRVFWRYLIGSEKTIFCFFAMAFARWVPLYFQIHKYSLEVRATFVAYFSFHYF
jgi:hypothetical protein